MTPPDDRTNETAPTAPTARRHDAQGQLPCSPAGPTPRRDATLASPRQMADRRWPPARARCADRRRTACQRRRPQRAPGRDERLATVTPLFPRRSAGAATPGTAPAAPAEPAAPAPLRRALAARGRRRRRRPGPSTSTSTPSPASGSATTLGETLFVEAGAGSGKTRALVERIVALVTTGDAPLPEVAAITFTEKAAAELRDRVRARSPSEGDRGPPGATRSVADRCAAALDEVDSAAIGTLHAFAQRLLSEHPIEAGCRPRRGARRGGVGRRLRGPVVVVRRRAARRPRGRAAAAAGHRGRGQLAACRPWPWPSTRTGTWRSTRPPPRPSSRPLATTSTPCSTSSTPAPTTPAASTTPTGCWPSSPTSRPGPVAAAATPTTSTAARPPHQRRRRARAKAARKGRGELARGRRPRGLRGEARRPPRPSTPAQRRGAPALWRLAVELRRFTLEAAAERRAAGELEFHDLLVLARQMLRDPEKGRPSAPACTPLPPPADRRVPGHRPHPDRAGGAHRQPADPASPGRPPLGRGRARARPPVLRRRPQAVDLPVPPGRHLAVPPGAQRFGPAAGGVSLTTNFRPAGGDRRWSTTCSAG